MVRSEHWNSSGSEVVQNVNNKRKLSDSVDPHSKKPRLSLPFSLQETRRTFSKKFNTMQATFCIKIHDLPKCNLSEILASLYSSLGESLASATDSFSNNSLVRVIMHSDHLTHPISTKSLKRTQMTEEHIITNVIETLQSCEDLPFDESLRFEIQVLERPQGEGRSMKIIDPEKDVKLKRSVITINNEDSLCMARAIVVLMAKINKNPQYKAICNCRKPMQKKKAEELHHSAGVPLGPCGVNEA